MCCHQIVNSQRQSWHSAAQVLFFRSQMLTTTFRPQRQSWNWKVCAGVRAHCASVDESLLWNSKNTSEKALRLIDSLFAGMPVSQGKVQGACRVVLSLQDAASIQVSFLCFSPFLLDPTPIPLWTVPPHVTTATQLRLRCRICGKIGNQTPFFLWQIAACPSNSAFFT